jgi:beta-glucosidase
MRREKSVNALARLSKILAAPLLGAFLAASAAVAQAPAPDSPAIEKRVDEMLSKLSIEQKIGLIGGAEGMSIRAVPAIGLPSLRMSDGPVGVRTWGPTTAYTAGIALAATWDPALAERIGRGLGEDARARGVQFLLGPGVNIYRAPMNGRNFEYFGEDPYLASRITVGYVNGVQSQGVVATVKHFALNNQEYDRHGVSSEADERTIREIYLPAFEAAVREAHVGAVMNSYNLINGEHATQNAWLNLKVLKGDWGFDGILMSDWAATYDGVAAARNGLDLEMPRADFMNAKALLPAIEKGTLPESVIDDKVRRILRTALRFGFLDQSSAPGQFSRYNQEGIRTALDEARESIVLVKNEGGLLPLDPHTTHTIAVIGPDVWPAITGGGGSSTATPYGAVGLLQGLGAVPGVRVLYSPGLPSLDTLFNETSFTSSGAQGGVKVETFPERDFTGTPAVSYSERIATWKPLAWSEDAKLKKSIRYSAVYTPQVDGSHLIIVAATASDGYELKIDGKRVMQQVSRENQGPQTAEVLLSKGKPVSVVLDYLPGAADPRISFGMRGVDELITPEAKQIASAADAVLVAVGYDAPVESEGFDRSYQLPCGQDALIQAVSKANKNTIVTLTSGGEVDTRSWIDRVPAFLLNWYFGEQGGTALAEILFGAHSPEGKLPISFAHSWEENPVHDNYYAAPVAQGETPRVKYAEGVFLGYRYYTTRHKEPLYPFGFGLSYSTFAFSNLSVNSSDAGTDPSVKVSFDVENTGRRQAAEVAELYVGDPSAQIERPIEELKAFQKVRLEPGQHQRVTLTLDRRAFSYWDVKSQSWKIDPGKFTIFVGDSSENLPLNATITLQ